MMKIPSSRKRPYAITAADMLRGDGLYLEILFFASSGLFKSGDNIVTTRHVLKQAVYTVEV